MSEFRHDPLTDRWVIISPERDGRPLGPKPDFCPFCYGKEDTTPIPEIYATLKDGSARHSIYNREQIKPDWLVRVIPNKFPALQVEIVLKRKGMGVFDKISGFGAHEVIIESSDHNTEIPMMNLNHIITILNTIRFRMNDLEKNHAFRYLSLFKNKGKDAGASLEHPHFQLNALPITPSEVARELRCCKDHFDEKERCLICDMLYQELEGGERIIEANEAFVVLSPFAARFRAELFIAPTPDLHSHSFPNIDDKTIEIFAPVLQRTLLRLMRKYNDPPYNIALHTAPFFRRNKNGHGETIKEDYHWHFHIFPRISKIAGFELSNDCYIDTLTPEEVAKTLREAAV